MSASKTRTWSPLVGLRECGKQPLVRCISLCKRVFHRFVAKLRGVPQTHCFWLREYVFMYFREGPYKRRTNFFYIIYNIALSVPSLSVTLRRVSSDTIGFNQPPSTLGFFMDK